MVGATLAHYLFSTLEQSYDVYGESLTHGCVFKKLPGALAKKKPVLLNIGGVQYCYYGTVW